MIMASVQNARTFDRIADAMILQHPRIHLKESRRHTLGKGTSYKGKGKGGMGFKKKARFGKGSGKQYVAHGSHGSSSGYRYTANIADEWYDDGPDALYQGSATSWYGAGPMETFDEDDEDDGDPAAAYIADSGEDDEEE